MTGQHDRQSRGPISSPHEAQHGHPLAFFRGLAFAIILGATPIGGALIGAQMPGAIMVKTLVASGIGMLGTLTMALMAWRWGKP